jgi:hypothetical protein
MRYRPGAAALALLAVLTGTAACTDRLIPAGRPAPLIGPGEIAVSVFLIGDAGAPAPGGEPVLQALGALLETGPDSSLVIFLGDNIYPRGLPAPGAEGRREAERRLDTQVHAVAVGAARAVFVPGNHDWDKSGPQGLDAVRRQGARIAEVSGGRSRLLPANGCPGPAIEDIGGLRIAYLDTEWWLTGHAKAGRADGCAAGTQGEVLDQLGRAIAGAGPRPVIVAGHHPLATGGEHGGYFSPGDHLFPLRKLNSALWLPLPLVGSLYPVIRGAGVSSEDIHGPRNVRLRGALDSLYRVHPPLLHAAGHEHSLQLIDRGYPPLLAVSGVGIYGHQSYVMALPESRLALSEPGFMRLDLLTDGRLRLGVLTVNGSGQAREVHAQWLKGGTGGPAVAARADTARAGD